MFTFLQRWWITNRFHKFTRLNKDIVWVKKQDFISYIKNIVVSTKKSSDNTTQLVKWPYRWIGEVKDDLIIDQKIANLMDELSDPKNDINYFVSTDLTGGQLYSGSNDTLRLSSRGREIYGISYLLFGHEYARKIWTFIIASLIVFQLQNIINPPRTFDVRMIKDSKEAQALKEENLRLHKEITHLKSK